MMCLQVLLEVCSSRRYCGIKITIAIFSIFFNDNVITYIAEQTNLYSASQRPEKPVNVGAKEVEIFP